MIHLHWSSMLDWIEPIATVVLGAATIALVWVTKTLARSTDQLARISGQDFRVRHSPIPQLMWHGDPPVIEGRDIVLRGAVRPFPGNPHMTLIRVLAESSVDIAGVGSHVKTLHESWPAWPLTFDDFYEFECRVPEARAAAADLNIGVTVVVAHPAEMQDATDRWLAVSELRHKDDTAWEIRLIRPFWRQDSTTG